MYEHFDEVSDIYHASHPDSLPSFHTRFAGRLESILASVKLRSDVEQLDIVDTALLYYVKITRGHPFFNGNKRMATHYFSVYLFMHNYFIHISKPNLVLLALLVEKTDLEDSEMINLLRKPLARKILLEN